jgi:PLP dependent protein
VTGYTAVGDRLVEVLGRIARAAEAAGRDPADIGLVAVSKTFPLHRVLEADASGQRCFGENRVQEAAEKIRAWPADRPRPEWHLIGHLQTNKARLAAELFDLVHSTDSVRVLEALSRHASALGRELPVLLEVHLSEEPTKSGFAPEELAGAIEATADLPAIRVEGLMTIAPSSAPGEAARPYFRRLRELRDTLGERYPDLRLHHLSMGMSGDFEAAIAEGATLVRLGRAIFGER